MSSQEIDNLIDFIQKTGVTIKNISKETGIPVSTLYNWTAGKSLPKGNYRDKLLKWINKNDEVVVKVAEPQATYLLKRREKLLTRDDHFFIPFMSVKAQAGYASAIDHQVFIESLEKYALPPGVDARGAVWMYWEVEGDSMEATFKSGDVILASMVNRYDWDNLRNFYVYIVVFEDLVTIKRVFKKDETHWVLIADNDTLHKQVLIEVADVKELWVYRRTIHTDAAPPKMFEIKV